MSVQSEITRIQTARNTLRAKAVSLGIGLNTDNLTQLATKYDGIGDKGSPHAEVKEGETYTIEPGYYQGGTVSGVSGGGNYNLQQKTVTPTKAQQVVNEDSGFYGLDQVTVAPIPDIYQDVSAVTATAETVLAGDVFVTAQGAVATGTMANNGTVSGTITGLGSVDGDTSFTIPDGYTSGGTVTLSNDIETALNGI